MALDIYELLRSPLVKWIVTGTAGIWAFWNVLKFVVRNFFPYLKYDLEILRTFLKSLNAAKKYGKRQPPYTIISLLEERAQNLSNKAFVKFDDDTWTYSDINKQANKVGRYFNRQGIGKGDNVAMMMTSQPLYVSTLFGLGKCGATSALINHNLKKKALLHSLNICEIKNLVISDDEVIVNAIEDVWESLHEAKIKVYIYGEGNYEMRKKCALLDEELRRVSDENTPRNWQATSINDKFLFIYTSGTTGFPKAASLSHFRSWMAAYALIMCRVTEDDIVYTPLPLYHTAGLLLGLFGVLNLGATIVVRKKFSASRFWDECRKHNATVVQYIGETMHYICNQPKVPNEKKHSVRLACGNGLRPIVWSQFLERFGNIQIAEFYGATEGVSGFFNNDNTFGSVGRLSPFMKLLSKTVIAKYDHDKEEIVRDKNGRVMQVKTNEAGLLLFIIRDNQLKYEGYHNQKANSDKKLVFDVMVKGDKYYNTGDLLLRDENYNMKFVDRVGDTFRWKGENVSTNEVGDTMKQNDESLEQVNVYGVEIPNKEGRCGMMAITLREGNDINCKHLYKVASDNLPTYARPVFIRVLCEHELTGTWKLRKADLVNEGFDLEKVGTDVVYIVDNENRTYTRLTPELYREIVEDNLKI